MLLPLLLNNLLTEEGGDEHNLAATSVESASEVSSSSVGQVHVLSATSVQSSSNVSSPTIGQIHALTSTSVESASEVSEPDFEALSEHALTAVSVQSLSEVSSPTLAQVHVLLASSVQALSQVSAPGLNEPANVQTTAGAGSSKRRHRKRHYVEIDGQLFEVNNAAEAEALLRKALATAETIATKSTVRNTKRIRRGRKVITPGLPSIKSSPELVPVVDQYRERINAVYRQIAIDAELRELMRLKLLEEDEEDAIFVLLH